MDHLSGHAGEIPLPKPSTYAVHHPCSTRPLSSTIINNSSTPEESNNSNKQLVVVASNNNNKGTGAVRYRECLKNHAASRGGTATDGCGEFMPSGEEGSLEALKCSACSCHRNFHRKEIEGEAEPSSCHHELYHYYNRYRPTARYLPAATRPQPPPALIMPLGAIHTESDEMEDIGFGEMNNNMSMLGMRAHHQSESQVKKRFRTKFTQEQKEKMLGFAERVGWKLQRTEEGSVQQLCQEIGVKRRVLKVWMHNNKHNLQAKMKTTATATSDSVTMATD